MRTSKTTAAWNFVLIVAQRTANRLRRSLHFAARQQAHSVTCKGAAFLRVCLGVATTSLLISCGSSNEGVAPAIHAAGIASSSDEQVLAAPVSATNATASAMRGGKAFFVTAFNWSTLTGQTYTWFDVDDYVINGVGTPNTATLHPILVNGVPKAPWVSIDTADLGAFSTGPWADYGYVGWYCDEPNEYFCATNMSDLKSIEAQDSASYDNIVAQLADFPLDKDIYDNYDARIARRAQLTGDDIRAWKLAALRIKHDHFAYDQKLVQNAIDSARDGDTIVLKATRPFYFGGATVAETDGSGNVTNGIPFNTAQGIAHFSLDWFYRGAGYYDNGEYGELIGWDNGINVNKRVTLTGETGRGGIDDVRPDGSINPKPLTVIYGLGPKPNHTPFLEKGASYEPLNANGWSGYQGKFMLTANGARLANLRLENFMVPIFALTPGFAIENNRIVNSFAPMYLMPDNGLTYPYWPSLEHAVKSSVVGNKMSGSSLIYEAIHILGSEIDVKGNTIENAGGTGALMNGSASFYSSPLPPLDLGARYDNQIEGNRIVGNDDPMMQSNVVQAGIVVNGLDASQNIRHTTINGNILRRFPAGFGVLVNAGRAATTPQDTYVRNNLLDGVSLNITFRSRATPASMGVCVIERNTMKNVTPTVFGAVSLRRGAQNCRVLNNDYSESGLPGWSAGSGAINLMFCWAGLCDSPPIGNIVVEWRFPAGTNLCDQVLDDSMTSENPLGDNYIAGWKDRCLQSALSAASSRNAAENALERKSMATGEDVLKGMGGRMRATVATVKIDLTPEKKAELRAKLKATRQ